MAQEVIPTIGHRRLVGLRVCVWEILKSSLIMYWVAWEP